jgi:hypothetical protein
MEGIIYIAGAVVFGVVYAFIKPAVDGPWLVAIAVAYFALLRLVGHCAAKLVLRKAISSAGSKEK